MAKIKIFKPAFQLSMVLMLGAASGATISTWSTTASALEYTDRDLMLQDYDGMDQIIEKIHNTDFNKQDVEESIRAKVKASLFVVLSRRDRDGTRGQLINNVQRDLDATDYYDVISEIANQTIEHLKDDKTDVKDQSTYLMVLENIVSEYRPLAKNQLNGVFTSIRDADIDPSRELIQYRQIKMTEGAPSPSEMAKQVLKRI